MNKPTTIEPVSLHMAMAMAFAEIEAATKSANNPHFKSKYADLGSVIEAVKPALIKHSLFFVQLTHEAPGGVCVETVLHHSSGESMSGGRLFVPANKNDAQGYGSALTYARRYSLQTFCGVPAEDDDGNAAAKSAPARQAEPATSGKAITNDQFATLIQLIQASGTDAQAFCAHYKVASVAAMPAERFDNAVAALNKKIASKPAPAKQAAPAGDIIDDDIPY
jgi:hypothetical protein